MSHEIRTFIFKHCMKYVTYHNFSSFNSNLFLIFYFPVVIMCASPSKVRDILLAAEALGMMEKGEYVFFNVELFTRYDNMIPYIHRLY